MLSADNLSSIQAEGLRLAETVRGDPERQVPQYPGWTLADLATHTASICGRTVLICRDRPTERISAPRLPEGVAPVDWFEETLFELIEALRESNPETPVWGFPPESTIAFWERRMVVETGVHRWDADQAIDTAAPLTDYVAWSGLEEFPDMWLPRLGEVRPLEMVATDLRRSWTYEGSGPTARVEGSASELYLRLVARPSPVVLPPDWASAVDGLAPPPKR